MTNESTTTEQEVAAVGLRGGWMRLAADEKGQTLTEYALILALIAVVVIVAVIALGGQITTIFNSTSSAL